jgi:hypothetical protein
MTLRIVAILIYLFHVLLSMLVSFFILFWVYFISTLNNVCSLYSISLFVFSLSGHHSFAFAILHPVDDKYWVGVSYAGSYLDEHPKTNSHCVVCLILILL